MGVGGVAMGLCPKCGECSCILMQNKGTNDIFEGNKSVPCNTLCDKCQGEVDAYRKEVELAMEHGVGFFCNCGSVQVIDIESSIAKDNKWEAKQGFRLEKCRYCSEDADALFRVAE